MKSKRARGGDFEQALEAYSAGHSDRARQLLERALAGAPAQRSVLDALSTLEFEEGRYERAAQHLAELVRLFPDEASYHLNRGEVQRRLGRPQQALESLTRALEIKPDFAEALINLGVLLRQAGERTLALSTLERALDLKLGLAQVQTLYADALSDAGEAELARLHERCATLLTSDDARVAASLVELWASARASVAAGELKSALACYHTILAVAPASLEAWLELGWLLRDLGRYPGAVLAARRGVELRGDSAAPALLLAAALADSWQFEEALSVAERALELDGAAADAHFQRGRALLGFGDVPAALACFRQAVQLDAQHRFAHSNLVFCMGYAPDSSPASVAAEARAWAARHTTDFAGLLAAPQNERSPDRRLKLGYVSEDFRSHPMANFLLPLLEHHDSRAFEVYCYSSVKQPDAVTERVRRSSGVFRDVAKLSDRALLEVIRADGIDVLVDLALFSGDHRLRVFAARPAPVQLTYLAYLGTSGVPAIDYRLSAVGLDDPALDGPAAFSESSLVLPDCYWCYDPLDARLYEDSSDATAPPALAAGHFTFGSQNSFHKLSSESLALWAKVLMAVPDSRLVAHAEQAGARRVLGVLGELGVRPERVTLLSRRARPAYLEAFRSLDLCLDTLPFNGVTTTLDACWMGVPTLTLLGRTPPGRAAAHVLTQLGLSELVAHTPAAFVEEAAGLSRDLPALAELRRGLRGRLLASPLMDAARFTRHLEALYRRAWSTFCRD